MKIFKKLRYELPEDLHDSWIRLFRGLNKEPLVILSYHKDNWDEIKTGIIKGKAVYLGPYQSVNAYLIVPNKKGKSKILSVIEANKKDEIYFYAYQGECYESEALLDIDDVGLLFEHERSLRKEAIVKHINRIKAKAEAEGSKRHSIPKDVQILVWNRDGGECVNCGSNEKLEFDHIIPVSKGGSNTGRNIQLLCENCNRTKGNKIGL